MRIREKRKRRDGGSRGDRKEEVGQKVEKLGERKGGRKRGGG